MADARLSYDKDQVRDRTDLLALIGQYVALRKRGSRYLGLCPFHQEKTPSFNVDPQKGFWHCFGCGKGGDAFNFFMQIESLTFPEALERLAERAGVPPIAVQEAPRRKEERDFVFEVNAAAAVAFRKALAGKAGAGARQYLANRGIGPAEADRFGLGYAPAGWDALVNHLQGRGFSPDTMTKADLARVRSTGEGCIDRFRNRLMIPIFDRQGRVVAFGGRALSSEDQPKYLNTGETPVFHKGRLLYGLNLAIDGMKAKDRAIVTEGYFDTIACHLAGFTETVATLGTALSEDHVRELIRFAGRIFLVFDADSAGVNAALRGQAMFRQAGADVRIVRLPAGHDPDTLIREGGAAAFEECLAGALAPTAFELERLAAQHPNRDTESRLRLFRAAAAVLQPLPRLDRAEYALWLIERWLGGSRGNVAELQQAILSEVAALDRSPRREPRSAAPTEDAPPPAPAPMPADRLEREVMVAVVQDPAFAAQAVQVLPPEAIAFPPFRRIFVALQAQVAQGIAANALQILTDDDELAAQIAALALMEPFLGVAESPAGALEKLRYRYEMRDVAPREIPLDNAEELREFTRKQIERSKRSQSSIMGKES